MNLITANGGATVNTNYTTHTHRVHYACPVQRPARATWRDWVAVVAVYAAGACALTGLFMGAGYLVGSLL